MAHAYQPCHVISTLSCHVNPACRSPCISCWTLPSRIDGVCRSRVPPTSAPCAGTATTAPIPVRHPSIHPPFHPSIHVSSQTYSLLCPLFHPSIPPSTCHIHLSMHPSIHQHVTYIIPCIHPSINMSHTSFHVFPASSATVHSHQTASAPYRRAWRDARTYPLPWRWITSGEWLTIHG